MKNQPLLCLIILALLTGVTLATELPLALNPRDTGLAQTSSISAEPVTDLPTNTNQAAEMNDSFAWLEDGRTERTARWIGEQNVRTLNALKANDTEFKRNYQTALDVHEDKSRILGAWPAIDMLVDGWVYNVWQDDEHPRGLWRRTSINSFGSAVQHWQTLLDIDAISRIENKPLVYSNMLARSSLGMPVAQFFGKRCLVGLGNGSDELVSYREFDIESHSFVKDGFALSEAPANRSLVVWKDLNAVFVVSSTPTSGGATIRVWFRGEPLSAAKEVLKDDSSGRAILPLAFEDSDGHRQVIFSSSSQRTGTTYWRLDARGSTQQMNFPPVGRIWGLYDGQWIITTNADWIVGSTSVKAGSLVSISDAEIAQPPRGALTILGPADGEVVSSVGITAKGLIVNSQAREDMRLWRATLENGEWKRQLVTFPDDGTVQLAMSSPTSNTAFATHESFLQPPTLYSVDASSAKATAVRHVASQFDSSRYLTERLDAVSKDGTHVQYYIVRPTVFRPTGSAPTLIYAYGALLSGTYPEYSGAIGKLWLDRGGVYVLATLRGGIVGSEWASLDARRQQTYEDLIAVSEDLIRRKITSRQRLGIRGHSLGGLLMGVMLNWRPDLFGAAVLENPVLDEIDRSPGGISFAPSSEADASLQEFVERTSPYQNLVKNDHFPLPLITTNTNDVAVRPSWARRYAMKLASMGQPYLYYENPEGNHLAHGSTPEQGALHDAIVFTYLSQRLMK